MIKLTAVTTGYGKACEENAVLTAISCTIPREKITVLVGPNGSGKSTLLKAACGFLPVWSGTIELDGTPLASYTNATRAKKIAYLAQTRTIPDITVERLVLHGRFPYTHFPRHYTAEDYAIAQDALRQTALLPLAHKKLSALSGGQQQKARLAMALAQSTPVLVLDEPLTFLDIRQQLELLHTLKSLAAQGKTVALVVHDLNTALTFADHLLVMSGGSIIAEGNPALIAQNGTIDRVFSVQTQKITLPRGENLYTFSSGSALV